MFISVKFNYAIYNLEQRSGNDSAPWNKKF